MANWILMTWGALMAVACSSPDTQDDTITNEVGDADANEVAETTGDIEDDIVDTSDEADTSDTLRCEPDAAPDFGCPCTNQPDVTPYCCTRASNARTGWICGGLIWYFYGHGNCDGDPRGCEICPYCPVEWEPPWWSGIE